MGSICEANCNNCGYGKNNNCKGCKETNGCPFGKQCFIAKYILTGGKATKYEQLLQHLASWGFIVVGNQDKGTGTGKTTITTLNYMLGENNNKDSIFYTKIDIDNIGITGHSQGGAATMNAIMNFEESKYFRTAVPLSPVS